MFVQVGGMWGTYDPFVGARPMKERMKPLCGKLKGFSFKGQNRMHPVADCASLWWSVAEKPETAQRRALCCIGMKKGRC